MTKVVATFFKFNVYVFVTIIFDVKLKKKNENGVRKKKTIHGKVPDDWIQSFQVSNSLGTKAASIVQYAPLKK